MTWSSLKLKIPLKYSGRRVHMYLYLVCKKEWSCVEFKKFKYSLTLFCQCECPLLNRICKENMKGIVIPFVNLTLTSFFVCSCNLVASYGLDRFCNQKLFQKLGITNSSKTNREKCQRFFKISQTIRTKFSHDQNRLYIHL